MASESIFSSVCGGEQRWADQISKNFEKEVALDINSDNIPVSVFNVPKAVSALKPEAYIPQIIALGPYHHLQPELYQMERFKLAAVKSFLKPDQILDFQHLVVDKLKELDSTSRACYHKYLDFDDDTLAWIIAVDGLFLLDLLHDYSVDHLNDSTGRKLTQDAILCRDVVVLENQIPFILLKEIRKFLQLSSPDDTNDAELLSMLRRLCEENSPLKLAGDSKFGTETSHLHLLDVMYQLIVNHKAGGTAPTDRIASPQDANSGEEINTQEDLMENLMEIVDVGVNLGIGGDVLKPVEVLSNVPWQKISNLLGLKPRINLQEDDNPIPEEIKIPSVSYLSKIGGIKFSPRTGGIRDIKFVEKEVTFYLPVLNLNTNSEVLLRNLVAYEAATSESSTLELAQYVGLMSGIIDSAEDAELLIERGIIKGNLSSEEIANLFNGMTEIRGREGNKTIEDVNVYFSKRPRVKAYIFIRNRVYASWKFLTLLSTVALLFMLILQSFCQVYGCPRFFGRIGAAS